MQTIWRALFTLAALNLGVCSAAEPEVAASAFGHLDHVFLIIMENETDTDILGNPNAPFINAFAKHANHATNYFAVGHPSLPNYLEIAGGSNFGVTNDYWPRWIGMGCVDNAPNSTGCEHAIPPIAGTGVDNPVVATASSSSECNGEVGVKGPPVPHNCALHDYPASPFTGRTIADQLVARHLSWKSYEESLPTVSPGVAGVNYADGDWSNLSPVEVFAPGPIQKLYAVKHNPFAYFESVQSARNAQLGLDRVKDFDGADGLWADLQGQMPNLAVIVPNQCHDMHGYVAGGTPICSSKTPSEAGFLIAQGDATVRQLVEGIKASPTWSHGRNAIVLVWDENDFSNAANRVLLLVETSYSANGKRSSTAYDHFSLLRTLEAAFGLPCLNHACDRTSRVMNEMFQ